MKKTLTRNEAVYMAKRIALDLPGKWSGKAERLGRSDWFPKVVHGPSGAVLVRLSGMFTCNPKTIKCPADWSRTPLAAIKKMLLRYPPVIKREQKRMDALHKEALLLGELGKTIRKK